MACAVVETVSCVYCQTCITPGTHLRSIASHQETPTHLPKDRKQADKFTREDKALPKHGANTRATASDLAAVDHGADNLSTATPGRSLPPAERRRPHKHAKTPVGPAQEHRTKSLLPSTVMSQPDPLEPHEQQTIQKTMKPHEPDKQPHQHWH